MNYKNELLSLYDLFPFEHHPLWKAIIKNDLSIKQILDAEAQHYLRTREGQKLRREACYAAQAISPTIFAAILDTYLEECSDDIAGPSHLDLIVRLLRENGFDTKKLNVIRKTPGNTAAIALYKSIGDKGAACHILGAGCVEYYYSKLCPQIFKAYTQDYLMSPHSVETYKIHGPMDEVHANRAFQILDESIEMHGWELVFESVRDAFVATSLHYDGMLQAATGEYSYWGGKVA